MAPKKCATCTRSFTKAEKYFVKPQLCFSAIQETITSLRKENIREITNFPSTHFVVYLIMSAHFSETLNVTSYMHFKSWINFNHKCSDNFPTSGRLSSYMRSSMERPLPWAELSRLSTLSFRLRARRFRWGRGEPQPSMTMSASESLSLLELELLTNNDSESGRERPKIRWNAGQDMEIYGRNTGKIIKKVYMLYS